MAVLFKRGSLRLLGSMVQLHLSLPGPSSTSLDFWTPSVTPPAPFLLPTALIFFPLRVVLLASELSA